jgi:hypothetical protein
VTNAEGAFGVRVSGPWDSALRLTHLESGQERRHTVGSWDAPPNFTSAVLSDDGETLVATFTGSRSLLRGSWEAAVVWTRSQSEPVAVIPLGLPFDPMSPLYCEWQR